MHYYSFNKYLKDKFNEKVRKISINAGFSCPHKNLSIEEKGCIFCNEKAFTRFYDNSVSIKKQIESSIVIGKKKNVNKFIAYFQNGTNTNASLDILKKTYDIIKKYPEIVGLSIATRPDCIDDNKLYLIQSYVNKYDVWIEYGMQTIHNSTLEKINRGHSFEQTIDAIKKTSILGIKVGVHIILGLPGENEKDMLKTAKEISKLPINGIKFHVLSVFNNTELANLYYTNKIKVLTKKEYINIICNFLEYTKKDCVILRLVSDANNDFLIEPKWINNKLLVLNDIEKELIKRQTFQGIYVD